MKPPVDVAFHSAQSAIYQRLARNVTLCLAFGRGLGKSWFARTLAYLLVSEWEHRERKTLNGKKIRGVRIIFILPTFKMFRDIHSRLMEDELSGDWKSLGAKIDHTTWTVTFPGGSSIQVFPASDHGSQRAVGIRADVVFADECDDISKSVFHSIVAPWFTEPWSLNMRILSGTPKRGRYGLLYEAYWNGQLGARLRRGEAVPGVESPEQIDALKRHFSLRAWFKHAPEVVGADRVADAMATSPPATFKREWCCDFDAAEGLVYGEVFNTSFHVREPPKDVVWSDILIGCDHGFEDPGVLLLIGVLGHGRDATYWVLDEIVQQHKTPSWWKAQIVRWLGWYPHAKFYGDPSRPAEIEEYRNGTGLRVQHVDNDIESGVARLADLFLIRREHDADGNVKSERARLYISPRCLEMIRELGLYRRKRDPRDPDRYTEAFQQGGEHTLDAARYALFNHTGGKDKRRGGVPHEALG